jgi:hypothetical protein
MYRIFYNCTNFNQPLNSWDISNVESMNQTFSGCTNFNQALNRWRPYKLKVFRAAFYNCPNFDLNTISNWGNIIGNRYILVSSDVARFFRNTTTRSGDETGTHILRRMYYNASDSIRNTIIRIRHNNPPQSRTPIRPYLEQSTQQESNAPNESNAPEELQTNDPNEQHYESDWRNFFNIVRNQREELTNSQIKININEDKGDDFITGESISVSDYLNEETNNVVFYFKNKVSFLSNKTLITNAINDKSAIKYGCIRVAKSHKPRRRNLRLNEPYFTLRSIGGYGLVSMTKIQEIINNPDIKCVEISSEPINNLVTTASFYVTFIEHNRLDVTGASHCQEGQEEQVYDLFNIPINSGGKRRTNLRTYKRRKHKQITHKRQSKRRRTNKRKTHKFRK